MEFNTIASGVSDFFEGLYANISTISAEVGMGKIYHHAKENFAVRPQEQQIGIGLSIIFTGVVLLASTMLLLKKWTTKTQGATLAETKAVSMTTSKLNPTEKPKITPLPQMDVSSRRVVVQKITQEIPDSSVESSSTNKKLRRTVSKLVIEQPSDSSSDQTASQGAADEAAVLPPPASMVLPPSHQALLKIAHALLDKINEILEPIQEGSKASEFPKETANAIADAFKIYREAVPTELRTESEILLIDIVKAIVQVCPSYQTSAQSEQKSGLVVEELDETNEGASFSRHTRLVTDQTGVMPATPPKPNPAKKPKGKGKEAQEEGSVAATSKESKSKKNKGLLGGLFKSKDKDSPN